MTQTPRDPSFEQRVRTSSERQAVIATVGAMLEGVGPGEVALEIPSDRI